MRALTVLISLFLLLSYASLFNWGGSRGIDLAVADTSQPTMISIPEGVFAMGDHYGYVDPSHPADEIPVHNVSISSFKMGQTDITVQQYCDYLNSAFSSNLIRVAKGLVYLIGGSDILFQTRQADQYSRMDWNGTTFCDLILSVRTPMSDSHILLYY